MPETVTGRRWKLWHNYWTSNKLKVVSKWYYWQTFTNSEWGSTYRGTHFLSTCRLVYSSSHAPNSIVGARHSLCPLLAVKMPAMCYLLCARRKGWLLQLTQSCKEVLQNSQKSRGHVWSFQSAAMTSHCWSQNSWDRFEKVSEDPCACCQQTAQGLLQVPLRFHEFLSHCASPKISMKERPLIWSFTQLRQTTNSRSETMANYEHLWQLGIKITCCF